MGTPLKFDCLSLPSAALILDERQNIVFANERACAMFGCSRDELSGTSIFDYMGDHRGWPTIETEAHFFSVLRTGQELRFMTEWTVSKVEKRRRQWYQCVVRDVSRFMEGVRRQDQGESDINYAFWEYDLVGGTFFTSPAWALMLGRAPHKLVYQDQSFFDTIHANDRNRIRNLLNQERLPNESFGFECRMLDGLGDWRWVSHRAWRVTNASSPRILGYSEDVHRLRSTMQRLDERDRQMELLVNNTTDVIVLLDVDGKVVSCNPSASRLFKISQRNLKGRSFSSLLSSDDRVLRELTDDASDKPREVKIVNEAGDDIVLEIRISKFVDRGKTQFVVVGRDITHRKTAEAHMLEEAQLAVASSRAKSEFLAKMSHEIRTPLNGVMGMLELLVASELSPREAEFAYMAHESAISLMQIINDILDYSRIEARKINLEHYPFNIRRATQQTVAGLRVLALRKNIELNTWFDHSLPDVLVGDSARLRQVLNNLIGNAIKFTDSGEVSVAARLITATDHAARIQMEVSDTGCGIAQEDIGRVFQLFHQVGNAANLNGSTGLGLAIVRQLVELMGGRVV